MGFENVYKCLMELFAEIDPRILRIVALDNSMNVRAAVNEVLMDVIPRLGRNTNLTSRIPCVESGSDQKGVVEKEMQKQYLNNRMDISTSESDTTDSETSDDISIEIGATDADAVLDQSVSENNSIANDDGKQSCESFETKSLDLSVSIQEDSSEVGLNDAAPEKSNDIDNQKSNANVSPNSGPEPNCCTSEMSGIEDGLMVHTIITQSSRPCDFNLLDDIIEDAKDDKVTLFSTMQSVMNEMQELEHREKHVENVREEAANRESEILAKVEEMKRMVAHAKELSDTHAGEVYGEKAILATETSELHSRLISLSDERDKSLSVLDEMHTTLEARLAAVDALLKATEEEKLANEEHARKALAEQEALVEKVVLESTILQEEAKENSKLREFLIYRGQVVDILQGEMSVICEDVMILKKKFDMQVPSSKSLCSSQTSCIRASSSSSPRTAACSPARFPMPLKDYIQSHMATEKIATSSLRKEGGRTSSVNSSSLPSNDRGEERGRNHFKAFSDDGWEVFF